jgi:hypothetical protein
LIIDIYVKCERVKDFKDCIIDVLTRLPQLTWLSAGQLDGELRPEAGVLKKLSKARPAKL